jgi:hypothetical protein
LRTQRRIAIAPRTVLPLLERYDELVALSLADPLRLQRVTKTHGRVILALDGLQLDVGHEVLTGAGFTLPRSMQSRLPSVRHCRSSAGAAVR